MSPRTLMSLHCLALVGWAWLAVVESAAQPSSSPFLPHSVAVANAPTAGTPIEFRGFMDSSEGMRFRLFDPARKAGVWVKLNEREPTLDVVAKQFAPEGETLVIEHQGRTLTLAQRVSKVVSSGSAMQNMAPPQMPNVPQAVTQAVVVNPTPADEARRLEAVASEVARRRALREQASQQVNPSPVQQQMQPRQSPNNLPSAGQQPPSRK